MDDTIPITWGARQRRQSPLARVGRNRAIRRLLVAGVLAMHSHGSALAASPSGLINAVGVENEYADVIGQIGGKYVQATAILTDPNTDPHSFEASPKIAAQVAAAELIVSNGIGYDSWADRIMSAAPNARRKVINVQALLGLPDDTPNPHLWYDPKTMPAVAKAVAAALSELEPAQARYFEGNVTTFDASLEPWNAAVAALKARFPNTPVAVTEPVADYMLQAAGAAIMTPPGLRRAVMNGTDPSPQDVTAQNALLSGKAVRLLAYNQQVTDALTSSFLASAKSNGVPVVGVYETMPTPGFTYQSWMLAEVDAVRRAVTDGTSTETLRARK